MRKIIVVTAFCLSACTSGANVINVRLAQTQKPDISAQAGQGSHYLLGKGQLAAGNIALALDQFRKELRENPQSINARNGLAVAYDQLGRFDLSRRYYEEALALQPENKMILGNLGYSLLMQGKKHEAEEVLATAETSTSDAPVDPIIRNNKLLASLAPETPPLVSGTDIDDTLRAYSDQWLERTSLHTVTLITKGSNAPRPWVTNVTGGQASPQHVALNAPPSYYQLSVGPFFAEGVTNGNMTSDIPVAASARPSVYVLNAARQRGIAARFSAELGHKGWVSRGIGDSKTRSARSRLVYDPTMRREALKLARSLSLLPTMHARPGVNGLVLFIGRDALGLDYKLRQKSAKA